MTERIATSDGGARGGDAPPAPEQPWFRRHPAVAIYLPFLAIALVVVAVMWQDYRLGLAKSRLRIAERDKDWAATIPPALELIEREPQRKVELYQKLGWSYLRTGDFAKSAEWLEAAKALQPSLDLAKPRMISYYETGREPEARQFRDHLLTVSPRDPAGNFFLARELIAAGKYAEAGVRLRMAAADPEWDAKAAPLREELRAKAFAGIEEVATATANTTTTTTAE